VVWLTGKPKLINQLSGVVDVDSGAGHYCALRSDGTVDCWGTNNYGQLGINSTTNSTDPKLVVDLSGAYQIVVGMNHVCVMIESSAPGKTVDIKCWSLNTDGQLGDGNNVNSSVPVLVK
jgi:alpha-tubulin suppressor-like RCC1 family protein